MTNGLPDVGYVAEVLAESLHSFDQLDFLLLPFLTKDSY
jgi:hypothetical protein